MYKGGMITARRRSDAVIAVCQRNDESEIEIENINGGAEFLTGYPKSELQGQSLSVLLPPNLKDIVESYVEYEAGGNDLAAVLKRAREFSILDKTGHNIPISLKVFYVPGQDKNPRFELLMRDMTLQEKMDIIKAQLIEEQRTNTVVDVDTDLPNAEFLRYYVNTVHDFIESHRVEACLIVMHAENFYDTIVANGKLSGDQLMKVLGERAKGATRAEDAVTYLGDGMLGLLLFDCDAKNAPSAINRIKIKMLIAPVEVKAGIEVSTTLNTVYHQLLLEDSFDSVIKLCTGAIEKQAAAGGDKVAEAVA